jgi:hypothetical protein
MITEIRTEIKPHNDSVENHSLYSKINSKNDLAFFMERHVFAVLDFMSLLSALKRNLLPSDTFWSPREDNDVSRFINEITLGEESDHDLNGSFISHFELYLQAMEEVGADTSLIKKFTSLAKRNGVRPTLESLDIPNSSKKFITDTFNLIEENSLHKIAASFCFGREKSIPIMFQSILDKIGIDEIQAPKFYYYIKRHIEIDGEEHGPMSENLLTSTCKDNSNKWLEAKETSISSLKSRKRLWDDIELELP